MPRIKSISPEKARTMVFHKGETITIVNGQYSDYAFMGVFTVLQEIMPEILVSIAQTIQEEGYEQYEMFMNELVRHGYLQAIPTRELYLGSYYNFDFTVSHGPEIRGEQL